jgi:hypothetical protein
MASRQRAYQKRHEAAGLCMKCRNKSLPHWTRCFRHMVFYYLNKRGLTKGILSDAKAAKRERLAASLFGRYNAVMAGHLDPGDDAQRLKDATEIRARLGIRWGGFRGGMKLSKVMSSLDKIARKERERIRNEKLQQSMVAEHSVLHSRGV